MPNWCENSVSITGPVALISDLWKRATENGSGLLEAMVPIGEWDYDKAVNEWGTKWDVDTDGLVFADCGNGTASIYGLFQSAWAPPTEAFAAFCETNDSVNIHLFYIETGMCFAGEWSRDVDREYQFMDYTSDTVRDALPEELVDCFAIDEMMQEWEELSAEEVQ